MSQDRAADPISRASRDAGPSLRRRPLADGHRWLDLLLVALVAAAVYLPSLGNGFAGDDLIAVAPDPRIRSLADPVDLLLSHYQHDVPPARSAWRPITTLSYAVSWTMGGGHPAPFHLFNVAAHAVASALVLSVLIALGAGRAAALLGALVFAVHPVHVEAVANVVGRADVLMAGFSLAAVWIYLAPGIHLGLRVVLLSLAYALAMGAKENGITLPLLLLLVEVFGPGMGGAGREDTEPRRTTLLALIRSWPVHASLAITALGYLALRRGVLGGVVHIDVASYIVLLPDQTRLATAVANLSEVVRLLVFPRDLSPDYGPAVLLPAELWSPRFLVGATILTLAASLVLAAPRLWKGGRWIALGCAWVAASFLVVSNLVIPIGLWLGERTLYLPSVGVSVVLAGLLTGTLCSRVEGRRSVVLGVLLLAIVLGGSHSWSRSKVWRDDDTLYRDLAIRHPESFVALWWLGRELVEAGDLEGGVTWLGRAVGLNPNGVRVTLEYARALLLAGRASEAEEILRPLSPMLHPGRSVYLAQSLIFQGRLEEASEVVRSALQHFPRDPRLQEQARTLGIDD